MNASGSANKDSGAAVADDKSGRAEIVMVSRSPLACFDGWRGSAKPLPLLRSLVSLVVPNSSVANNNM